MRNGIVTTIFCLFLALAANAQAVLRPDALVDEARQTGKEFSLISLFQIAAALPGEVEWRTSAPLEAYAVLALSGLEYTRLLQQAPDQIALNLPFENRIVALDLVKINADPVLIRESQPTDFNRDALTALHYRGVVRGTGESVAAFSFFESEIMGLVSVAGEGNLVLGKLPGNTPAQTYLFYRDTPVMRAQDFDCHTDDDAPDYLPQELEAALEFRNDAKCTRIYLEVDHDIFTDKGGTTGAVAYVTGLFNQVATLYANENLSIVISEIFVWTTNSPYAGNNPATHLNMFQTLRPNINGDLGHLLSYKPSGGIAVLAGLCHPLGIAKLGVSGIRNTYANLPAYSWSVMVVAHELGHQFGSRHTHACAWNGNNTAIDGCAGSVEGSCPLPPLPPPGMGTIMSYCHITPVGINLSLGFGAQPGNVMRNRVAAAACLAACTTGGNGGENPTPNCAANRVFFRLVLDNYPTETTWRLTNSAGQILKSGGPYLKTQAGQTVLDTLCLPNGCYAFRIMDSYSDGICCAYGNGSYSLRNAAGQVLASGGQFGSEEIKSFCLPLNTGNNTCVNVNFSERPVISYGGAEDQGTHSLLTNNTVLRIQNNAWKAVMLDYNVTPNTVLQFDFGSTARGEIHGIGFDDDNVVSANRTFKLFGTQNWGILNYNNYPGQSTWIRYTIPVGQFYTGSFNRLFFVADHDAPPSNSNSFFRNIRIYEGANCQNIEPEAEVTAEALIETGVSARLSPNPAQTELNLHIYGHDNDDAPVILRVFNAVGQLQNKMEYRQLGDLPLSINVDSLPPGTYFLAVNCENFTETLKFIKQ